MATKQLLIYETAVPVSKQRHADWSVRTGADYEFARGLNAAPLIAAEFPAAAAEYAIVFSGTGDAVMPSVIMGVAADQNLYVSEAGGWGAKYVPAFIRRYPFIFSSSDDGASFRLCIDEHFAGCNQEGRGERLFDADGERTQYLGNVLEFLKQYQVQFRRTRAFCARLVESNLLEPMRAQFTLPSGTQSSLGGFMAVDREKLKGLADEKLAEMARSDELELIYLHLQSMRNFASMVDRATGSGDGGPDPQAPDESNGNEAPTADVEPVSNDGPATGTSTRKKRRGATK